MQDGFQKRLAELENSRQQELQSARDSEILVGEQVAAINKKYDAQVLQAKKEFYESRKKLMQDYTNQYRQLWREIADIEAEIATSKVNVRAQDQMEALGFNEESIDNIRNYYNQIRDIANEQAKKIAEINKEQTQVGTDSSLEEENQRNRERLEVIKQNYEDGLLTKEEYDKAIQDENDVHYKKLETITRQGEQNQLRFRRNMIRLQRIIILLLLMREYLLSMRLIVMQMYKPRLPNSELLTMEPQKGVRKSQGRIFYYSQIDRCRKR